MFTLVILSDTHRSQSYIDQVLDQVEKINPDQVWHLGDDYIDADCFIDRGYSVIRVPGTWRSEYQMASIDNRRYETILGWRFFLTHTPEAHFNDLMSDEDPSLVLKNADIDFFCHGHTHHPKFVREGNVWILNPGHLKEGDRRGYPPSYAILKITEENVSVSIRTLLTDETLHESICHRSHSRGD